ncbi:MAG: class I SAM-dependent methyltransferase [Planctomycetota bacterium]|nr:MAG: class I SAM-dependent methyltransferase [Planctomycetota bacterium]
MSATLDRLYTAAHALWIARADLRAAHGSIHSFSYWSWLLSDAMRADPELAALLPMPPPELMARVVGTRDPRVFHDSGLSDASNLFHALALGGFDPARGGALLDFGCGCGRILRALARLSDAVELHGTDVDAAAIEWDRAHLDFARFERAPERPPLAFPSARFDALLSFSVFSHLPEDLHFAWLCELHRITRPGAVLVLTVQGVRCWQRFQAGDFARAGLPAHAVMERDFERLRRDGFVYYPYGDGRPWVGGADASDQYGMTFVLESYVRERWSEWFEVVAYRAAVSDWQDHVVLRRR